MERSKRHVSVGWLVLTRQHNTAEPWQDSGEGPFETYESAEAFADAEVGADYIIVEMYTFPTHGASGNKCEFSNRDKRFLEDYQIRLQCEPCGCRFTVHIPRREDMEYHCPHCGSTQTKERVSL